MDEETATAIEELHIELDRTYAVIRVLLENETKVPGLGDYIVAGCNEPQAQILPRYVDEQSSPMAVNYWGCSFYGFGNAR